MPPFCFYPGTMSMINKFQWAGDQLNLGRFGLVKPGDILFLTDKEAEGVKRDRDKRYVRVPDGKQVKAPGHFQEIDPKTMTPLQMEQAAIENHQEEQRLQQLASENDPERVILTALRSKSSHELYILAAAENEKAGREIISTAAGTSLSTIISELAAIELRRIAKPLPEAVTAA